MCEYSLLTQLLGLSQRQAHEDVDSLRGQLSKKESDLARLRGQRDDLIAELSERRAGEIANFKHVDEIVALSNSHLVRPTHSLGGIRYVPRAFH